MMIRLVTALVIVAGVSAGQTRPKILGVAHVALATHNLQASEDYYHRFLGYDEVFNLPKPDNSVDIVFIKINERQYIELSAEAAPGTDRLKHIALQTDNAEQMRLCLRSKGVSVPDRTPKGRIGNSNFMVKDPEGHDIEIVQ